MFARHFIDSVDFAHKGREIQGEVPLAEMHRLQDRLASPEGNISYVVRGLQDRNGQPALEVTLQGLCQLRCQRCLNELAYSLQLRSRLRLLPADELDEFSDEDDEADSIAADTHLDVLALLEEEILLSLPFAPAHSSCRPGTEGLSRPETSPFAVLAGLKGK